MSVFLRYHRQLGFIHVVVSEQQSAHTRVNVGKREVIAGIEEVKIATREWPGLY
jgi:hypothetical protein